MTTLIRSITAALTLAVTIVVMPSPAHAGVGNSATPTFPDIVTVGDQAIPASITFTNQNTPTQAGDTNLVCNFGSASPCPNADPGVTLTASCGRLGAFSSCEIPDADVFRVSNTATGRAGTACDGWTFAVESSDAATGRVRFTPSGVFTGQQVALPGAGSTCTIDFTFDVIRVPSIDFSPAPGLQTVQITDNTQYTGALTSSARGTSTGITVERATPTLVTTATPAADIGAGSLTDTVVVTGQQSPDGTATVDFHAYGPNDPTCAGQPAFSDLDNPYPTNGGPVTSDAFTPGLAGTYRWIAVYSGDANNEPVSGACNDPNESSEVAPTTPAISTAASGDAVLGDGPLTDTATLSGLSLPQPGATVSFELYGPNDVDCSGPVVFSSVVELPVSDTTVESDAFAPGSPGTYQWVARYSGDANNSPAEGDCGDPAEQSVVSKAVPTITTEASGLTSVGGTLTDTATVTGRIAPAASTVDFYLYGPDDATCSDDPVFTSLGVSLAAADETVSSEAFTPTTAGVYRWVAEYRGDANNESARGACGDPAETVTVFRTISRIVTQSSPGPVIGADATLTDTATVFDRIDADDSGTIDFRLYGPNDGTCSGTPAFQALGIPYPASGGPLTSPEFEPTIAGVYRWVAEYSGDTNNSPAVGVCGDPAETVTVVDQLATDVELPATGPGLVGTLMALAVGSLMLGVTLSWWARRRVLDRY